MYSETIKLDAINGGAAELSAMVKSLNFQVQPGSSPSGNIGASRITSRQPATPRKAQGSQRCEMA